MSITPDKITALARRIGDIPTSNHNRESWAHLIAAELDSAEPLNARELTDLISKLQIRSNTAYGSLWAIREIVMPRLLAQVGFDQMESARKLSASTERFTKWGLLFGGIQAFGALVALISLILAATKGCSSN